MLVHRANRLLSESTLILCRWGTGRLESKTRWLHRSHNDSSAESRTNDQFECQKFRSSL